MSAVVQDFRLESQLHKDGFAVWPAENTKVFTALAQAFTEFCAVTATELQQLVLGQLKESLSGLPSLKWAAVEAQIRSQQLSSVVLELVLKSLAVWKDADITLHDGETSCQYNQGAAQHIHLAASNVGFIPVRPLTSDSQLYLKAPTCFSKASCHTHCIICRRSCIKLIGSHIYPNKMVRSTTGPGMFSFNFANGTRGSPDILTYHGFCEACDGSLNTLGEQKAGEDLHRLAKNFRDAWKVQASRVPHFFYAMFSISWRVLAVSGQAAGNVALCQILNQGRLYLQYPEHFGNPACIPGWLMLYTVPNQADVDYVPTSAGPPASGEPGGKHMLTTCFASSASIGNSVGWQVLQTRAHSTASLVSQPLLAQALYLGPYHQLTILDESVGLLLSNVKWDGLRILSAQYPLRVGRSITRMRSTVLTDTFNKCIRQAIPHMVRAFSSEGGQNQPIFHYTSDIVMNLVPENDWYVDFPDGIRLVNNTKFRAFSASFRTRDWGGDKLVLMVDIFQEKRFYEKRHQWRMEWDNQCKFLCLLQLQHRRIVIRMWLVGKNEAGIVSASWNKGVLAMADHAGFGEIIPWKQAIEALLREAWYVRH
ncbi:TPA: hypothetical protein ACH3X2_006235 [Trebouxia sp. C0005]